MRVRIDFVTGAFRIFAVGWALQERQIVESQAGANLVTKGTNFIHLFGFSGVTMRHNGDCKGGFADAARQLQRSKVLPGIDPSARAFKMRRKSSQIGCPVAGRKLVRRAGHRLRDVRLGTASSQIVSPRQTGVARRLGLASKVAANKVS